MSKASRNSNGTKRAAKVARGPAKGPKRKVLTARLTKVLQMFTRPELAKLLGISRQSLHAWRDVHPKYALAIEKASGGTLTKEFLAPHYYPPKGGAHVRR